MPCIIDFKGVPVVPHQSAASLRARYVEQAAADLEENRCLQGELAARIKALQQEEALLVDILALAKRHAGSTEQRQEIAGGRGSEQGADAGVRNRSGQPLLGDILTELLGEYDEPRHAKELRDELLEKHPGRASTPQVVRNTLESLVAKGKVRRDKQNRSVLYALIVPAAPKAASASMSDA
ncbi:hypothetical protein [Streptomyces sp. NPDC047706]|uniref:hypothetical protein n=1 Tax=Streptomyces sp. NPDC047706 TaxID=3365486 RepID=UPI003718B39C